MAQGGFISFFRAQHTRLPVSVTPDDVRGKTYIVTGSNTGLGYECVLHLARSNAARVIIAARSTTSGEAAVAKIRKAAASSKTELQFWHLDISSVASIKEFASRANRELDRIDGLIENAGIALMHWTTAPDFNNWETSLAVNVFGTFLHALLLFPKLQETSTKFNTTPYLVFVTSNAALQMEGQLEKIGANESIFESLNTEGKWPLGMFRYPTSKLLGLYAARKLASLAPFSKTGVVINAVNPGVCRTGLNRHADFRGWLTIEILRVIVARSTEVGSRTLLHGIVAGSESHGKYLSECRIAEDALPDWMSNQTGMNIQSKAWDEIVAELEKIEPGVVNHVVHGWPA